MTCIAEKRRDQSQRSRSQGHVVRLRVAAHYWRTKSPRIGRKVAHATGNNVIIDSPCVSQFYLLKLVTGNQTATSMKFAVAYESMEE